MVDMLIVSISAAIQDFASCRPNRKGVGTFAAFKDILAFAAFLAFTAFPTFAAFAAFVLFVAFVAFMSGSYSYTVNVSDWMQLRSPNMFIFEIYFYAMPLVSLIFMGLPFVSTFEVMSLATLGFLVIVPLVNPSEVGNAWVLFESKSVYR